MAPNSGDLPPHVQRLLATVAGEKVQVICMSNLGFEILTSILGRQPGWRVGWGKGDDHLEEEQGGDGGLAGIGEESRPRGEGRLAGGSSTHTTSIKVCPAFLS